MSDRNKLAGGSIKNNDDSVALFQNLGIGDYQFQDFSKEKLASEAYKKWTLLEAVPVGLQAVKHGSSKLKILRESETGADSRDLASSATAEHLLRSEKLDLSVDDNSDQVEVDQCVSPPSESRVEVQPHSLPVARSFTQIVQKPVLSSKPRLTTTISDVKHKGARSVKGLFSDLHADSLRQPELVAIAMDVVIEDVSLTGVFLRLEQAAKKRRSLPARSRFFRRLGK